LSGLQQFNVETSSRLATALEIPKLFSIVGGANREAA
jgi:hypothetical protein